MMDPRHLRVLRAVARSGSYSAAARELGYSQPAISQQMRALERSVGAALTVRSGRQTQLTEAGRALLRHTPAILASLTAAQDEVAAIGGLRGGRVRIVSFPSGSAALVPAAIASLAERHPGLRVTLEEAEPPESVASLRAGDVDVALTFRYPPPDPAGALTVDQLPGAAKPAEIGLADLTDTPLLTDHLVAVLPAGHPLAGRAETTLADLADERWIAGCPRCRGHLVAACARAGFSPNIAFATDDYVAVQGLIAAGLGVGLVPDLALRSHQHRGVAVSGVRPALSRDIGALTLPDLTTTPGVRAVLAALRAAVSRLPERP
jgi:molybdate transport repressor ModE-like protein